MHKKIWMLGVAATLLSAAIAQPTLAQTGPGAAHGQGRGQGKGMMQRMGAFLGLTDDQKAKITPIMKKQGQQMKAIRANTTLSPAAKKAKTEAIRKASRQQIMGILTPEQKAKLKQLGQRYSNHSGAPKAPAG